MLKSVKSSLVDTPKRGKENQSRKRTVKASLQIKVFSRYYRWTLWLHEYRVESVLFIYLKLRVNFLPSVNKLHLIASCIVSMFRA